MNQPNKLYQHEDSFDTTAASAANYLKHAREINHIAGNTLKFKTREPIGAITAKISLGLSLQAAELAGKAILRALGHPVKKIINDHKKHAVDTLLKQVERELRKSSNEKLTPYHDFLLWKPTIDRVQFETTIADYFERHFAKGPSAFPRNYLYPDFPIFTGPNPIQALFFMVEHLIEVAERIVTLTEE
jgi:hypothetical protein